ncbi:MAG: hypothetical protein MUF31_03835 [Akkermansiaceae bacterium]|jgi:hypothetical protein|nr:hypothetical protein [Akkermansiaceae bacterium]
MGQQLRKVTKRNRRKNYLKRKKEQAKLTGTARKVVKKAVKKAAPAKKAAVKKTAVKKVAKKAAKKVAKPEDAETPEAVEAVDTPAVEEGGEAAE